MIVKLLTDHLSEFLSLKECCRGSPESTLVKMSNCWKSHAMALSELQVNLLGCREAHQYLGFRVALFTEVVCHPKVVLK